jgi:hypothetical protein
MTFVSDNHKQITPVDSLSTLSDEAFAALSDGQRSEIARAETEAQAKRDDAARAAQAFKAKPTAATLATKDIEAQLAENAEQDLAACRAAAEPIFAEEKRRAERRELEQLRDTVAIAAKIEAHGARIVEAFREFEAVLSTELTVLGRAIAANNNAATRHNDLAHRHGAGSAHASSTSLDRAIAKITERLEARFGRALLGGNGDDTGARVAYLPVGHVANGDAIVNASLRFKHTQ